MTGRIASFRLSDMTPMQIPEPTENDDATDLQSAFSRKVQSDVRTKPSYADFWVSNPSKDLKVISEYRTQFCSVTVGDPMDGEMEYAISPLEFSYPDGLNAMVLRVLDRLRSEYRENGGRLDRDSVIGVARGLILDEVQAIEESCPDSDKDMLLNDLCNIIYRYSVGAGVFEILLTDPHIEDVYLDAPCNSNRVYVTLNGIEGVNSHIRCRTNIMVETREVDNLINILKRESGLRFSQSNPVLETDFPDFDARATIVGYPLSPNGNAVAIRKHSSRPWTLSRLIYNGTIDPRCAGILSFLVDNRCTFLICGPRGAGKSSLLSALMFEFPKEQRILTIEDTRELPIEGF